MNEKPLKIFVFRKHPRPPEVQTGDQAKLFIVRHADALGALGYWLAVKKYNTFVESLDAQGNTLFGLIYDCELGVPLPRRRKERGTVAVWEKALIRPTVKIILDRMIVDNEYSRWWRDTQIEKYSIEDLMV